MSIADVTEYSAPVDVGALTDGSPSGDGIFDTIMRGVKSHLEQEFTAGRLRGPEYATVYLGMMEAALKQAFDFVLLRGKSSLEQDLLRQQLRNAVLQGKVLIAQECELQAQFDLLVEQKNKTTEEKILLQWKTITEKAQTTNVSVDDNSVIGRQKILYLAQADGFKRDAEQKATKLLADTWSVRRTTDEGTSANTDNKLADVYVGRAVDKLLAGIGA